MTATIKLIAPDQYPDARDIVLAAFQASIAPLYSRAGAATFAAYVEPDAWQLRDRFGHYTMVALRDNAIAGVAHVRDEHHLSMLFVQPAHQGEGIGSLLFHHADQRQRLASVHASPNAMNFYRQLGFLPDGELRRENGICFAPMRRGPCGGDSH